MIFSQSRYLYCDTWIDNEDRLFLDARKPYRYRAFPDNVTWLVKTGESIFTIAGRQYAPMPRAAGLWWVIADFQPNPIHDPTIVLAPGSVLVLPSMRTVNQEIFSARRVQESRL